MNIIVETPQCLRNDGGLLRRYESEPFLECDICGDKWTPELLDGVYRSTWEALRLGYQPTVRKTWGAVARITTVYGEHGWMTSEVYLPEDQPVAYGFSGVVNTYEIGGSF